jgi:hypothetical protein
MKIPNFFLYSWCAALLQTASAGPRERTRMGIAKTHSGGPYGKTVLHKKEGFKEIRGPYD